MALLRQHQRALLEHLVSASRAAQYGQHALYLEEKAEALCSGAELLLLVGATRPHQHQQLRPLQQQGLVREMAEHARQMGEHVREMAEHRRLLQDAKKKAAAEEGAQLSPEWAAIAEEGAAAEELRWRECYGATAAEAKKARKWSWWKKEWWGWRVEGGGRAGWRRWTGGPW